MVRIVRWVDGEGGVHLHPRPGLERRVGTSAKVVASTRVTIPSTSHPRVPYYVLLLEDEHGQREPRKSMVPCEVGAPFQEVPDSTAVAAVRVKYALDEDLRDLLGLLGVTACAALTVIGEGKPHHGLAPSPLLVEALEAMEGEGPTVHLHPFIPGQSLEAPEGDLIVLDGSVGNHRGPAHYRLLLASFDHRALEQGRDAVALGREAEVRMVGRDLASLRRSL